MNRSFPTGISLEHQWVVVKAEKERHQSQDAEETKMFKDAKVELIKNAKETSHVLESRESADWSALHSAIKSCDCMKGALTTVLAKLQVQSVHTATFDHLERHSSEMQVAEDAVPERMKSRLRN